MTISFVRSNLLAHIRYCIGLGEHPRVDEWRAAGRAVIEAALGLPDMETTAVRRPVIG
jgi:hypothetical protein